MDSEFKLFSNIVIVVAFLLIGIIVIGCTYNMDNVFSNEDKIQIENQIQQTEEYKTLNETTPEQPIKPEENQIIQNYYITGNENNITINNYKKDENKK